MFDGALNVQLAEKLFKVNYPILTFMPGVEHTLYLFFNYISKIPILHQTISSHKMIYNIFGSGIYISKATFHFSIKISIFSQ